MTESERPLFLSESEVAHLLKVSQSTMNRLARTKKLPGGLEPIWITEHTRRYRRVDVERLAGLDRKDAA